jgi:hypothetical protein
MAAVAPPTITALPPAPQRLVDAPAVYVPKADAFADALVGLGPEVDATAAATYQNALAAAASATAAEGHAETAEGAALAVLQAAGLVRRVTDNLAVGAGAKDLTGLNVPAAAAFANGEEVALIYAGDNETLQWGVVSLADMGAGTMRVTVAAGDFAGTGPQADWIVVPRWFVGLLPATAAELRAGLTATKGSTAAAAKDAAAQVALTDATTIAWDTNDGVYARLTLTANGHTVGAPTNLKDGWPYVLDINPATYTAAWNALWYFGAAGAPSLPASAWSTVTAIYNANRNKLTVVGVLRGA